VLNQHKIRVENGAAQCEKSQKAQVIMVFIIVKQTGVVGTTQLYFFRYVIL